MKYLDKISFRMAIIMTIFLGLAPFVPEPHLWQKLKMLTGGAPFTPLDVFDVSFHLIPALILLAKIYRRKTGADQNEG